MTRRFVQSQARRNQLLGLWAAEKLGLLRPDARSLCRVPSCTADLDDPGSDAVLRKLRGDFDAKKVSQSDHQIRRTWSNCWRQAVNEIEAGR